MVKRKRQPKEGEWYYYLYLGWGSTLKLREVSSMRWKGDRSDDANYEIGNCFRTRRKAFTAAKKIKELLIREVRQ